MITLRAIRARMLAAAAALLLAACSRAAKDRVALVGVNVVDGTGGEPRMNQTIVVYRGHIETIGPSSEVAIPKTAETVDLSGRWVIPGLIDAHTHVARWALSRYLAYGVTTVRDLHGQEDSILALRDEVNLGAVPGPRLYVAGAMIDGDPPTYPDAMVATNPNDARRLVDNKAVARVDVVKTYTRITPDLMRAIVDEAHTLDLQVASHLGLTDAVTAADIGVRSIEHLSGVPEAASASAAPFYAAHRTSFFSGWTYFERSWAGLDSAALARVADHLVQKKVFLVPTLVLHDLYSRLDDQSIYEDPDLSAMPDAERQAWNVPGMIQRAGWTTSEFAAFRRSRPNQDLFVREFHTAGGVLVTGTDSPNQMLVPGASEVGELELLVNAGLSPQDAILAATANAAALLGADSLGQLATGRPADLVVLRQNPLDNISNVRLIDRVMVRGVLMRADSIRAAW